ncbi:hypothetical protein JJC00_18775 [Bradyrhizobium diazoefficiens]|uniref:hypothetical protein n=1 Tax=Bradyrhizobium diazoefficiens TaxID=1355477 RepID=UPI00190CF20C|nr:hypothetical protein [Bradyrhizobium diazoefficiens]QQO30730.1 hypothetical protein JJC00_18775 [Bradyrhizobium diazoefficiens]
MTAIFAWLCAAVAAVATLGAAYFFDKSAEEGIEAAKERAAHADATAAQAHERTAALEKEAAEANARAAQYQLRFQQLADRLAPRIANETKLREALAKVKPVGPVQVWYAPEASDTMVLAFQIANILRETGWTVDGPQPIPDKHRTDETGAILPKALAWGAQPWGLSFFANGGPKVSREFREGYDGLANAIGRSVPDHGGSFSPPNAPDEPANVPAGSIRLIIAGKQDPYFNTPIGAPK